RNDLKTVPVDRLVGSVRLTSGDLNAYLDTQPGHVQLAPAGQGMRVSAPVDVPAVGRVTVFGDVRASVHNNGLTLAPAGIGANGASALTIPSGAMKTLTTTIPLSGLPMNLRLVSAKVTPSGIQATAEVDHLTLDTTQTAPALRAC
ncbi:MAG: LmeA family phospholipid-binding protein, partial [Frankia sp.]